MVFEASILITAAPTRVLDAFFNPAALRAWWQATRSVTTPRPLGVYAVEWDATSGADELLGRFGGVFYGIVVEYQSGRELLVGDAYWLPPDTDPVGPMSLQVTCALEGPACGFEESARWRRYYTVIERGWKLSMEKLKNYVERA